MAAKETEEEAEAALLEPPMRAAGCRTAGGSLVVALPPARAARQGSLTRRHLASVSLPPTARGCGRELFKCMLHGSGMHASCPRYASRRGDVPSAGHAVTRALRGGSTRRLVAIQWGCDAKT